MSVNLYNATTDTLKNVAGDIINPKSVNEMIAPIEDGTASKAYSVGEQFVMNDILYESTQDISQGGNIVVGSNCKVADDITTQIGNIKSDLSDLAQKVSEGMILDIDNAVTVTTNFIAPFNGVLFGSARTTANAAQHLLINGKNAALIPSSNSTPAYVNLDIRGIEAGSIFSGITGYATDFIPIFVPYKTN